MMSKACVVCIHVLSALLPGMMPSIEAASFSSSSAIVLHAAVKPVAKICSPGDECIWEICPDEPGTRTKKITLNIKANCPWELTAKDLSEICGGYMTEWTESGYGARKLSHPVKIQAVNEAILASSPDEPIFTGTRTGPEGKAVTVALLQTIDESDLAEPSDGVYRIAVEFDATPVQATRA
jgi:hypothetical protein